MAEALIQPQGFARLNPDSRIALNAQAVMLGGIGINVATGVRLTGQGELQQGGGDGRLGIITDTRGLSTLLGRNVWLSAEETNLGTKPFIDFWYGYATSVPGSAGGGDSQLTTVLGNSNGGAGTGLFTRIGTQSYGGPNPDSWGALFRWNDIIVPANDVLTPNVLTLLVVVRYSDRMELWRDGILRNVYYGAAIDKGSTGLAMGTFVPGNYWTSYSRALLAGRSIMAPTADEIKSFSANPWLLFEDSVPDDEPAGPTYIFPFAAGTLALSGSNVRLIAARRLAAASAGYTMTSIAAALVAARRLPAATGALAVTGAPANLSAARRLPGASGAIALSGGAAKLTAARKLPAQAGTFALTGGAATFVYTPRPGGQGPTYTLTGGASAFLVSASTARLLLARRMVGTTGAFSAAGAPAALVMARRLSSETGAFAIATAAGSLRAARRLVAAPVSFSLAGSAVTLVYKPSDKPGTPTYTLTAVGGSLVVTGAAANLHASRRMLAAPGQVVLTGSPANLVYGQQIVYARAPAGSGYTPRTNESQHRPASAATARPAAIQRNNR